MSYSKYDTERIIRMTRSRMQLALDDLTRIRANVFDTREFAEAELALQQALDTFRDGEAIAASYFDYNIRESMPT